MEFFTATFSPLQEQELFSFLHSLHPLVRVHFLLLLVSFGEGRDLASAVFSAWK